MNRYVQLLEGQYIQIKDSKMISIESAPLITGNTGMLKVGRDIMPGEYKIVQDGSLAYVEILKDSSGYFSSIVTNDSFEGEMYITIQDGQYVKLLNAYINR